MISQRRRTVLIVAGLVLTAIVAGAAILGALQAKVQAAEPLSAYVPQGALMAVESPDFGDLLAGWMNSEEEKRWIESVNYAEFSRSRLFSRLGEAQSEFAASAGLAPDANFLSQVAGKESVFAWYDIGKLEFLYVTRMKPGGAAANPLMRLAPKFQMRKAGTDSFYIRAEAAPAGEGDQGTQGGATGSARTVAFAVHGDLLLLATRENLIANALLLAQHQGDATLRSEPWYVAATGAAEAGAVGDGKKTATPDLRMTLNLTRIVPSPYFRSYWVQRNVSEMKQYGAAAVDLYRSGEVFREERVLIPKSADAGVAGGDLRPVLRYLPIDAGVYRATAAPGTTQIVEELDRRLISREASAYRDMRSAPVASLSDVSAGSATDLDTRIDEQPVPEVPKASSMAPLRALIDAAHPDAMLVFAAVSTGRGEKALPEAESVFSPMHSAVVLSAATPWDADAAESALARALAAQLTVGGSGLVWQARQQDGESWMQLSGLQPLVLAVRGSALIVASDSETLLRTLRSAKADLQDGKEFVHVLTVAGFSHAAERDGVLRLNKLMDWNQAPVQGSSDATATPAFFSANVGSLSETFNRLDAERFIEELSEDHAVRQRVTYRWRP